MYDKVVIYNTNNIKCGEVEVQNSGVFVCDWN